MIVVLDTDVLVSGLLKPYGPAGAILRLIALGMLEAAHDYRIMAEYREVLARPVFGFPPESVEAFLAQVEEEGPAVTPPPLTFRLSDSSDEPFLEVALASRAEILLTGNKRHFVFEGPGPRVLAPAEFLAEYGSK